MDFNNKEFNGVFYFTNPTKADFVALWNNEEYVFPAGTCCPMIMPKETAEHIQEIRKKFAYKLAMREFYEGKEYTRLVKLGKANPSTFDEKLLEPVIEACLQPLPMAKAKTRKLPNDSVQRFRSSKAIGDKDNLNEVFKDEPIIAQGEMPVAAM